MDEHDGEGRSARATAGLDLDALERGEDLDPRSPRDDDHRREEQQHDDRDHDDEHGRSVPRNVRCAFGF